MYLRPVLIISDCSEEWNVSRLAGGIGLYIVNISTR